MRDGPGRPTSERDDARRLQRALPIAQAMGLVTTRDIAACAHLTQRGARLMLQRCAERGWAVREARRLEDGAILWRIYPPPPADWLSADAPDSVMDAVCTVLAAGEMTTGDVWQECQRVYPCTLSSVQSSLATLAEYGGVERMGREGRQMVWRLAS